MNKGLIAAALLFLSIPVYCEEPVKISVEALLNPDTRLRAFQQFRIRSEPKDAENLDWEDLDRFKTWHSDLWFSPLRNQNGTTSYLFSWHSGSISDDWSREDAADHLDLTRNVLVPHKHLHYLVFSPDGTPQTPGDGEFGFISDGIIADLNRDGEPEVIEAERFGELGASQIPGLTPVGSQRPEEIGIEFLQVRPRNPFAEPLFGVVYNTHTERQAIGNTWGFQISRANENAPWEIQLGPVKVPSGIEPKVSFHWDKERKRWAGPDAKPGDHFRVLTSKNHRAEAVQIVSEGGLKYPLLPSPAAPPLSESIPRFPDELDPALLSKPYCYQSLAGVSDEQIFAFMSLRRTAWQYIEKQVQEATKVPDFWTLEPQAAALAYVRSNRPPATFFRHLISVLNPVNEAPPEKGDLTVSDGPSGCFAPGGAFVHHLHCAPEGSFLVYTRSVHSWYQLPPTDNRVSLDFRKLDIPYEQARHILQTVWWLSRVRSRPLVDTTGSEFSTGGSTSDGRATVQITSPGRDGVTRRATRAAGHTGAFLGLGELTENYDPSAFINLVVKLFRDEVPDRLGEHWKSLGTQSRWDDAVSAPEPHTPSELARIKEVTRELLRLYRERKLPAGAALEAVRTVGILGWKDLRAEVEQLASVLPPLLEHEKRLAAVEKELEQWIEKLGKEETSYRAHRERESRRMAQERESAPSPVIPGLEDVPGVPAAPKIEDTLKIPLLSAEEEAKFGEFDELYKKRDHIRYGVPTPQQDIASLREAIPSVLRQLDSYDDPEALFRWAKEDRFLTRFVLSRLVVLDRKLALELLVHCEQNSENEVEKHPYVDARQRLEQNAAPDPSAEERVSLISALQDRKVDYSIRQQALDTLVPAKDPNRYTDPAIDEALRALLEAEKKGESIPSGVAMALARRLGSKAWEPLTAFARKTPVMVRLRDELPALVLIARREGEPYRAQLRDLLAPELRESHGGLDAVLWSIWQLDLLELKAEVERIATSGADDYEGTMGYGSSSHKSPVKHRYHRARHVAAMWNEEDAFTRARLLVAFAITESSTFTDDENNALEHLGVQLKATTSKLAPPQRESVTEFMNWCRNHALQTIPDRVTSKAIENVTSVLQRAL